MMLLPDEDSVGGVLPLSLGAGRRARILIADDDRQMCELLLGLVRDLGYEAVAVPDGAAALAAVAAQPPDLVLSDVTMPGLSGFDLCRRLKADTTTRLLPVVLITGIGDEHKIQGIEAGADDFLGKPFSLPELRARIRSLLRMKTFIDELEHAEAVLCALGRSIEARDSYTEGHCERLADYSVALGRVLGLDDATLTALRRGGYLHDLGKVAVPDAILLKPGPLTPAERKVLERHPVVGEEICRPLRSLQGVLPLIRHHHERWDGSGYPDGLRGEAIPITARILQVVDVYDALTTDRPYRRALPPAQALATLEAEAAQGWADPALVGAFRHLRNGTGTEGQRDRGTGSSGDLRLAIGNWGLWNADCGILGGTEGQRDGAFGGSDVRAFRFRPESLNLLSRASERPNVLT